MRSLIRRNGTIPPPRSLVEAVRRQSQLKHESAKIEAQLHDPNREKFCEVSKIDYAAWRGRAERACTHFQQELEQLATWIEARRSDDAIALLKKAGGILTTLDAEEVLEPEEQAVLKEIDVFMTTV